jgi:two-component system, LytTR family, response regulator
MKYRSILIEDEEHSRRRLRRLLADFPEDIEVVGEAEEGLRAVGMIRDLDPDLLFLDINLPGLDGFQVLANLSKQPAVIFTTASDQHALEAFKTFAVDYLLKPIDGDALRRSIEKLRSLGFHAGGLGSKLQGMAATLGNAYLNRVICKVGDRMFVVKAQEIMCFQSDNKYTSVLTSAKRYLIDTPLVELEGRLDPKEFIRIHRSTLVSLSWIAEIRKSLDGKLKLVLLDKPGTELPVSRMFAENLKAL